MVKENDMVLNMLANPQFTVNDFQSVGLTGDNTNLLSEDEYKRSEKITQNENFIDEQGNFDEAKFHNFYIGAGHFYNDLATQDYNKAILEDAKYSKDNIWVEPEKRTEDYAPKLVREPNETLVTNSLQSIGKKGARTKSISEIAQAQQVYDYNTGEWKDSPNDSFFSNFFETLVLATYDEDVVDEQTGEVIHEKGSYKLNEFGTPYYETLGGRDVYGKQVLNKMNILTTDGSTANKFDFFDSDDIDQKSLGGTLLKNVALVGSMFLPYVGPAIIGASVATQTAGLLATLGKLIVGNDNETLNNIQGWTKTVNRSASTEYASQNTWCGENFLNMIGDTIGQLAEQRWIFKAAPTLLTGDTRTWKALSSQKGREKVIAQTAKQLDDATDKGKKVQELFETIQNAKKPFDINKYSSELIALNNRKATKIVDDLIAEGSKISSPLSKAYMTGITVQDTYGEAKQAGASDMEAALLTLGYAAGEAAILNTGLGEWIMPELKGNNFRYQAIQKALSKDMKEAYGKLKTTQSKQGFVQNVLNIGKKIAKGTYAQEAGAVGTGLNVVAANAAGESFEEMSEELLSDVSKSIFNVTRWLRGEESLNLGEWEGMRDRYLMSGLGGFVGGGITSAATDFNVARNLSSMNRTQALQELLYIVNNNEDQDFLKSMNKVELGNKRLSAEKIIQGSEEGAIWAEADGKDNQDAAIKSVLTKQVGLLKDILDSEGARLSTDSLINKLTLEDQKDIIRDVRFTNLRSASSLGKFLQDYQNIQDDLVTYKAKLLSLGANKKDSEEANQQMIDEQSQLEAKLEEIRKRKEAYDNGQMSAEFIRDAVFELNPALNNFFLKTNLLMYAEHKLGKKWADMSDEEHKSITEEYKNYSKTNQKDDVHTRAAMFQDMMELATPAVLQNSEFIKHYQEEEYKNVAQTQKYVSEVLKYLNSADINQELFDPDSFLGTVNVQLAAMPMQTAEAAGRTFFNANEEQQLLDIKNTPITETYSAASKWEDYKNVLYNNVIENINATVQPFIDLGYINPEVKTTLKGTLINLTRHLSNTIDAVTIYDYPDSWESGMKLQAVRQKKAYLGAQQTIIEQYINQLNKLTHTPIIQFLEQFKINTTNSDLNIMKHWNKTIQFFNDNKDDLEEFGVEGDWEENNKEAIQLIDAFATVIQGMRVDNADFDMPSSYTKLLNNVFKSQGVQDYVELAEIDAQEADLILQDAQTIKSRLEFAQKLTDVNRGQKLKQQDKVATNKNYLLYNNFKRLADVVPDDWDKSELEEALLEAEFIDSELKDKELKISKEEKEELENAIIRIDNSIYNLFNNIKESDGSINKNKLNTLLKAFAGDGGFFQKTDGLLDKDTKSLDDNSFIWYLASRAAVKSSDFHYAYKNAITDKIAPIASQELATYLGVAAVTNMNMLNSFVDAYRDTVVTDFNNASEEDRAKLLNNFDGSSQYAKELLKYFGGHDVLPQYKNMIFIEGVPGSGKSKGVFASIKAVVDGIDPELMKNVVYAHATKKSADDATQDIGFENAQTFDREGLMKYISSEWKDIKDNSENTDVQYLYKDSYEINDQGQLVNKWKLNKYTDAPKIMFIDEITHYNQQELSMIEQFARENGTVVLTAGDLDQDTQHAYVKLPEYKGDVNLTINRNNFIRTPKLGVTLRTLNRQMTSAVGQTQLAIQQLRKGETTSLNFKYLDSEPNHSGLFGVRTYTTDTGGLKDSDIVAIIPTIDLMVNTLKNGEKIGYIYSKQDSNLYKLLSTKYKDKVNFYSGSDAQGLEGQYYIVENDISASSGNVTQNQQLNYISKLYTGITRAEQGVLAITPSGFGNIDTIGSSADNTFQLEPLTEAAIKRQSESRLNQLSNILQEFDEDLIKVIPPTIEVKTNKPEVTTGPLQVDPTVEIPTRVENGYTDIEVAKQIQTWLKQMLAGFKNLEVIDNKTSEVYDFVDTGIDTANIRGLDVYIPYITLKNGTNTVKVSVADFKSLYTIRDKTTQQSLPVYEVQESLIINQNGRNVEVLITDIKNTDPISYEIYDGTQYSTISQDDLQAMFVGYPNPNQESEDSNDSPDNGYENDYEEYAEAVTETNLGVEHTPSIAPKMTHLLYTNSSFEMNVDNINDQPIPKCPQEIFDQRIDGAIGLMHLLPNASYSELEQIIAYLNNDAYNLTDNVELAESFKDQLELKGNVEIRYAIKSSAGMFNTNSPEYYRYWMDRETEALQYMHSDDMDNAKKPMREKVVIEVAEDGVPVFEMAVATLNSPLTMLFATDSNGSYIYPDLVNTYMAKKKAVNADPSAEVRETAAFQAMLELINTYDGDPEYQGFVDLCKLWQFTQNGIFYLHKDFNLASNNNQGPELIKRKGDNQLDASLQFTAEPIPIEVFVQNPKFKVSSILTTKDGYVNNKRISKLKPGHSFVLVSNDNTLDSDQKLVDQFIKEIENPVGNPKVTMVFVMPPKSDVGEWLVNQHNLWDNLKNNAGHQGYSIGNDFTAYRILQNLLDSGEFDNIYSQDETTKEVKDAVLQLNAIEDKWNQQNLNLSDNIIQGRTEAEWYNELKAKLGEKDARRRMTIMEQKQILKSKPDWPGANVTSDKNIMKRFGSYLTHIVWHDALGTSSKIAYHPEMLNKLVNACMTGKHPITSLAFKPQFMPQKYDVGPFIRIQTSNNNKYSIGQTPLNKDSKFLINAKLESPTFSVDSIAEDIHFFAEQCIYYDEDKRMWKYTSIGQNKFQKKYLNKVKSQQQQHTPTISETITKEYQKYFDAGILNPKLLDDSQPRFKNLLNLAADYTSKRGQYGFIYNDKLYLTKLSNPDFLIMDPTCASDKLDPISFKVSDSLGNETDIQIWFDPDDKGFVKTVNCRCTKIHEVDPDSELEISEGQSKSFVEESNKIIIAIDKKFKTDPIKKTIFNKVPELIAKGKTFKEALIEIIDTAKGSNKSLLISKLNNFIKTINDNMTSVTSAGITSSQEILDILNTMLEYVKSVGNFSLNVDDIVRINTGDRLKISEVSGETLTGFFIDKDNNIISQEEYTLTDENKQNIKKEEPECASTVWNLI